MQPEAIDSGALNESCQMKRNDSSRPSDLRSVDFFEVAIRAAGLGHGRAQLGPHQAIAEREDRAARSSPAWPAVRRRQLMISGMVMNGPTPIMSIMFSVVALRQADAANQFRLLRPDYLGSCPTLSRFT